MCSTARDDRPARTFLPLSWTTLQAGYLARNGDRLTPIPHSEFATFNEELTRAVEATFPGFGYTPEEIARFLSLNAKPYEDSHFLFRRDDRTVALAMCCGDLLEYVVPVAWEGRYEAVAETIADLKGTYPSLRLQIRERVPSHAAWFAALLPGMGFDMTPRVRMLASVAKLMAFPAADVELASMEGCWLEQVVTLHLDAYGLAGKKAYAMEENLRESMDSPDRMGSWTVALLREEVVGSCFGSHHRGRIFVEELAVSERHRGRGFGRALLLQSVGKLSREFPEAEKVVLDVDRMSLPALRLYRSLGFTVEEHYTVAQTF